MISTVTIYLPLGNLIDVEKSRQKLEQRAESIRREAGKAEGMLNNGEFKTRAPQEKVDNLIKQVAD